MIVTPEGLNVFPEDVERALNAQPGVQRLGGGRRGGARIDRRARARHPGRRAVGRRRRDRPRRERRSSAIIRRSASAVVWPERELPRTEGTRKLKRRELRQWLAGQHASAPPAPTGGGRTVGVGARALLARAGPSPPRPRSTSSA